MAAISVFIGSRTGVEALLGPTLDLVARRGPIRVAEIVRQLAQRGLLGAVARRDAPNVVSEPGQAVVEATIALKESGLLAPDAPGVWRATPAGTRLLRKGDTISFETLRRRPKYREYLRRLTSERRRRDWQALRFDSYVSGRLLTFDGSFHAAPAALAYALEYSLKAALAELRDGLVPAAILKCHDFPKLYHTCLEHDLLVETFVSDDFLQYAQHHFERRYPSGQSRLLSERKYWTFGGSCLSTYDDCLLQIDGGLDQLYGSSEWSLGNRALTIPSGGRLARAFFHDNVFAIARLPRYRTSVGDGWLNFPLPEHLERPELLFASGDDLPCPGVAYQKAQELLSLDLAALFVYPEASAPHPDPARTLLSPRGSLPGNPHDYEWILKRLREEFGFSAVEVVEDKSTRAVTVVIYDRGAKHYWAALPVSHGYLPLLIRNGFSRELLERWIGEARTQFASERRALRLPKQQEHELGSRSL